MARLLRGEKRPRIEDNDLDPRAGVRDNRNVAFQAVRGVSRLLASLFYVAILAETPGFYC